MKKPSRIYLSSPHMGADEFEFVKEAFSTNWIAPLGPHVDSFEREFALKVGGAEGRRAALRQAQGELRSEEQRSSGSEERSGGVPPASAAPPNLSVSEPQAAENPKADRMIHAAALSSGTAALHLALKLVGLKPGDEVFCSSLTFSASANPIAYEGGKPVFIDSERQSWNMDPVRLEEALEDRAKKGTLPRAVIAVHLYGQCADIDAIAELCNRYGVPLIEDAAEALGATYYPARSRSKLLQEVTDVAPQRGRDAEAQTAGSSAPPILRTSDPLCGGIAPGTVGRLGIYSFNGNKIITTSGGGMLVSHDETLIKKARFWATQARDPAPHYQHSEIGYNYRMSNVLAGIGRGQLRVLEERVNARRWNCEYYQNAFADLPGIEFMPEAPWNRCTRWLTCILVDPEKLGVDREKIRLALEAENIEARPVWKPMHRHPVFAGRDHFGGEVAEDLFNRGLCLPSGSNLSEGDLQRVVEVVRRCGRG